MNTSAAIHRYPPSVARRLRICFVTETYPPEINGVAMTASQLVSGLLTRGHEVQLIRPSQGGNDIRRREGRLEIVPQPSMTVPFYREVKLGLPVSHVLLRLWRQKAPDVVHICTEGLLGGAALHSAQRLGLPVSSGFHTNFHRYSGGNVMLEAMASGLAAVAFDYAAAHQFIAPDSNGLLVPFGDTEAFIEAARYLACRPAQRQRLGQAARRTMETVGWEQVCEHLEVIFLELIR